jgi:hypothetical protein
MVIVLGGEKVFVALASVFHANPKESMASTAQNTPDQVIRFMGFSIWFRAESL